MSGSDLPLAPVNLLLLCGLLALGAPPADAQTQRIEGSAQRVTLVELFTSEGCSSCPPAERWLNALKDDPRLWHRIVPVAFHVDYWDYIGWPDRFASPIYSARQRAQIRAHYRLWEAGCNEPAAAANPARSSSVQRSEGVYRFPALPGSSQARTAAAKPSSSLLGTLG